LFSFNPPFPHGVWFLAAPTGTIERRTVVYQQGKALMNDCYERRQRCIDWLAFKADLEVRKTTSQRSNAALQHTNHTL